MAPRPKLSKGFHVKFFGNARNVQDLGKYLPPLHQFATGAMSIDNEVHRVSKTRLLKSCSIPAKHPLGCVQSEALVDSDDVIVLFEDDQVVPNLQNEKDKV